MIRKEKVREGEGLALALIYGILLWIITITVSRHGLYILNFCQHRSSYNSWQWSNYEMGNPQPVTYSHVCLCWAICRLSHMPVVLVWAQVSYETHFKRTIQEGEKKTLWFSPIWREAVIFAETDASNGKPLITWNLLSTNKNVNQSWFEIIDLTKRLISNMISHL